MFIRVPIHLEPNENKINSVSFNVTYYEVCDPKIYAAALILLQSCLAYHDLPVSLSEAHNQGKCKVVFKSGELIKFKNIMREDSENYFVLTRERHENLNGGHEWTDTRINLDSTTIAVIQLKDIKKSKRKTTLLVVTSIPATIGHAAIVLNIVFAIAGNGF